MGSSLRKACGVSHRHHSPTLKPTPSMNTQSSFDDRDTQLIRIDNTAPHRELDSPERLHALEESGLMDTPPEEVFDRLTRLTARFLNAPVCLLSIVSDSRQFFKSAFGLEGELAVQRGTPACDSVCQCVVKEGAQLMISDTRTSPLLKERDMIVNAGMISYMGYPVMTPDGFILGSFCVIDHKERIWEKDEIELIREFARTVNSEIGARIRSRRATLALSSTSEQLKRTLGWADCLVWEGWVDCTEKEWSWRFNIQPSGLFHRLFGERVPPEDVGLYYRFQLPDQAEMDARSRKAMLKREPGYSQEFRVISEGQLYWLKESVTITPTGPNSFWLVGVATDITALKKAEEKLRLSERLTRTFAQYAPASVAMFDRNMRYLVHSAQWLQEIGRPDEDLTGKCHYDLFPDLPQEWKVLFGKSLEGEVEHRDADRIELPDGSVRCLQWESRPWHYDDGTIGGILVFMLDITARVKLEESLALARDEALEASKRKSAFLASMSHEIRTPMNGIIGVAGLLLESAITDDQKDMSRIIQQSGESLLTIINDILDFSKIEAGKLKIDSTRFFLRSVVEDVVVLLSLKAKEKGISLCSEIDESIPSILIGDPSRIRQIVMNLVGNAVKFTDQGSVVIGVSLVKTELSKTSFRVTVKDTGAGIPYAVQAKLFKPYEQEDGSRKRREGTGLGLSISKQLVELMGGSIGFRSVPGSGSEFWFDLSLDNEVSETKAVAETPVAEQVAKNKSKQHLLIVEDNPANQIVAESILQRMGFTVTTVDNGLKAIQKLPSMAVDGIIMDCQMPVMDGFEATRMIRNAAVTGVDPQIPIIALTAYAMVGDRARCLDAGMNEYVSKPIRTNELKKALRQCGLEPDVDAFPS